MNFLLRHNFIRGLLLLLALFSCTINSFSDDSDSDEARKQWLIGFKKVKEAMDAETQEDKVNALMLYKESLKVFATVKDKFPNYNPPLITYRIDYSRKKIAELSQNLSKGVDSLTKEQLLKLVKELHRESSILKKNTVRLLRRKKLNDEALARARKEAGATQEIRSLNQVSIIENKKLRDQLKQKEGELKKLELRVDQLSKKAGIDKELAKLQQSYNLLKGQRVSLVAERDEFKLKANTINAQFRKMSIEKQVLMQQLDVHKGDGIKITKLQKEIAVKHRDIKELHKDNALLQKRASELRSSLAQLKTQLAKTDDESKKEDLQGKYNKVLVEKEVVADLLTEERDMVGKVTRQLDALQKKNLELRKKIEHEKLAAKEDDKNASSLIATRKKLLETKALANRYLIAFQESEKISASIRKENKTLLGVASKAGVTAKENVLLKTELKKINERLLQLKGLEKVISSGDSAVKLLQGKLGHQVAKNASLNDKISELTRTLAKLEKEAQDTKTKFVANSVSETIRRKLSQRLVKLASQLEESRVAQQRLKDEVTSLTLAKQEPTFDLKLPATPSKIDADDALRLKALVKMGTDAELAKKSQTAIQAYKQILEIDGTNNLATKRLGLLFVASADNESGVYYLKKCLDRGVVDASMYRALGFAYIGMQDYYMAISVLTRAVAEFPEDGQVRQYLAVALQTVEWGDASRREYDKAFKLDPKNATIAFNLAVLLATSANESDLKEAQIWYKKALALGAKPDSTLEDFFTK